MNRYKLRDQQIIELEPLHNRLKHKRQADRVKSAITLTNGGAATNIAEILLIDEKTSRNYFQTYKELVCVIINGHKTQVNVLGNVALLI